MSEYQEVEGTAVEEVTLPNPPQQIELNAQVVDKAFRDLQAALMQKLNMELAVFRSQGLSAKEKEELHRKVKTAGALAEIAKIEVDRVLALVSYFQLEIMYKSSLPPQQQQQE